MCWKKLLIDAFIVGIMTVVVGKMVSYFIKENTNLGINLPPICNSWNKNYVMEWTLFLTGFLFEFVAVILGINGWYCRRFYWK